MKSTEEFIITFVAKDGPGGSPMGRYFTVKYLAKEFHRHPRTIYRWLDEGYIRGKKVKDGWLIPIEEVQKIIRDPFEDEEMPSRNDRSFDATP